jgi:NADP-dependent 3-hydroxy acid dehydrogenase YdfG
MEHSIALITGTTSWLGYAAARSLTGVQETAAQLAAETKTQVFTPLELNLDSPSSVQSALAQLGKRGRSIGFLLLNAGMVPGKKRVLTSEGIEAAGPAHRPSSTDCRIAPFPKQLTT